MVISLSVIALGFAITWMGYFFHFQNICIPKAPLASFKEIFMGIATLPMRKLDIVAVATGAAVTVGGFIFLVVSLSTNRRNNCWMFFGSSLLLSSFPVLHIWGSYQQPLNLNGPACVSVLMNLIGWIFISVGLVSSKELKAAVVRENVWIAMNVLTSIGVFLGSTFLVFGSISAARSATFSAGIALLAISLVSVLSGALVGIVAYAKSRHHEWELETIIERQKDIKKIRQLQRTTEPQQRCNNIV